MLLLSNLSRKTFGPKKYLAENILDPQNINEKKFRTYKIPTRKNFGPKKSPQEKNFDPWHKQEKKFGTHEIPPEKNMDPQRHDGTMARDSRRTHSCFIENNFCIS